MINRVKHINASTNKHTHTQCKQNYTNNDTDIMTHTYTHNDTHRNTQWNTHTLIDLHTYTQNDTYDDMNTIHAKHMHKNVHKKQGNLVNPGETQNHIEDDKHTQIWKKTYKTQKYIITCKKTRIIKKT